MERHGAPQEAAEQQYMCRGDGVATATNSSQWLSSSVTPTRRTESGNTTMKKKTQNRNHEFGQGEEAHGVHERFSKL